MKKIFQQGEFKGYRQSASVKSAREIVIESAEYSDKTPVFISHKHDDLADLEGVIGMLESKYNVKCYIDSRDPSLPNTTSGKTASEIKKRIVSCKKFILLATNGAIESKWCNWELGYGDAKKFDRDIAILPMKPEGRGDDSYKGSEYMEIYPSIVEIQSIDSYLQLTSGLYIIKKDPTGKTTYTRLENWFRT